MAKTKIYSMCSTPIAIPTYLPIEKGETHARVTTGKVIMIAGGANVAYTDPEKAVKNRKWVITELESDELETAKKNSVFKRALAKGFISIGAEPKEAKADKAAQKNKSELDKKAPGLEIKTGKAEA